MRREALRALRGRKLRSEAYALDGSARQDKPFVVTEAIHSFRDLTGEALSGEKHGIFFAYSVAQRTTNWDRGDDPATTFSWSEDYDAYGQPRKSTSIACPRGFGRTDAQPAEPFLSTHGTTSFIHVDQTDQYMVDRTAETYAYRGQSTTARTPSRASRRPSTTARRAWTSRATPSPTTTAPRSTGSPRARSALMAPPSEARSSS